jgi:magnesium chelatase subunit I
VIRRRDEYERHPAEFVKRWKSRDGRLRTRIRKARERIDAVLIPDEILEQAARLCIALGTDGLRGELTLIRGARAVAALEGAEEVTLAQLREVAGPSLSHRLRRNPLDESASAVRVERAVEEVFGS